MLQFQSLLNRARGGGGGGGGDGGGGGAGDVGWQNLSDDARQKIVEQLAKDMLDEFDKNNDANAMTWWTPIEQELAVCRANKNTAAICRAVFAMLETRARAHWEQGEHRVPDSYMASPHKVDAVIELVRKREGIDLKNLAQPQRVAHLIHARKWAHRHWEDREAFTSNMNLNAVVRQWTINTDEARAPIIARYGWIEAWDTSNVTEMTNLFSGKEEFNEPIGAWNTSSVTNMSAMFFNAKNFNRPIQGWDTTNVNNMAFMFRGASSFNQPIREWNVANVTNMSHMFVRAKMFNQPIGTWNTNSLTTMLWMFYNASSFNQPIGDWNTSGVTNMDQVFDGAKSFNQPLAGWNTGSVTSMVRMFSGAESFNQDISHFDISNLDTVNSMCAFAKSFSQEHAESLICKLSKREQISTADLKTVFYAVTHLRNLSAGRLRPGGGQAVCPIKARPDGRRSVVDEVFRAHALRV